MSDIYITFMTEMDVWKETLSKRMKGKDLLYLLGSEKDFQEAVPFEKEGIKNLIYESLDEESLKSLIGNQFETDEKSLNSKKTKAIYLSKNKKYFNAMKAVFHSVSKVGYQKGPEDKIIFRDNKPANDNTLNVSVDSYCSLLEEKKSDEKTKNTAEEPASSKEEVTQANIEIQTVEKAKKKKEEVTYPMCGSLEDAKAAVCYYLRERFFKFMKKQGYPVLTEKEIFQVLGLLIRCDDHDEFNESWKTSSNKTIILRSDNFVLIKALADHYYEISELFYKKDPLR